MFDDPFPVKRCVCFNTTFAVLKASGIRSIQEAAEHFGCGTKCGTCIPYIEKMIESGSVEFSVIELPPPMA